MKYKIEVNYLDIRNYPSVEKHFEDMANQGWLIKRVISEKVFIYKKIKPEELDFLIMPYKMEAKDHISIEEELEGLQAQYKAMGWDYITKSRDLHIYFKEKGYQARNLEDDQEEKFKVIEKLAKKQLTRSYISITILIFLTWLIVSRFFSYPSFIKFAWLQAGVLLIPIFIILSLSRILSIKKFLQVNRENIKIGKKIEYSKSKFYIEKIIFFFNLILAALLMIYLIYIGFILKNNIVLLFILQVVMTALIYPIIEFSSRISSKVNKERYIFQSIIFITIIGLTVLIMRLYLPKLIVLIEDYSELDVEDFRVLSDHKSISKDRDRDENIYQNISLLVPKSYKYSYWDDDKKIYVDTEYSNSLNEDMAKTLFNMYKKEAKHQLKQNEWNIEMAIEEDNYKAIEEMYGDDWGKREEDFPKEKSLEELGLSLEEFEKIEKNIKTKAVKEAIKIMEAKAINKGKESLWNADKVYFLSYDKEEIVIRKGKEVFFLSGKDFSDPETIKIVKNRLGL